VLLVEEDGWAARVLSPLLPKTFVLTSVISGGAALDSASERGFDIALVRDMLPDLPGRMVVRNLSVQAPEAMVLLYSQPQPKRPGRVERSEGAKLLPLIADWLEPKQLADRLRELFQAQLARRRERKHLAEFRSEHIELLRRFSDLRKRTRSQIGDFEAAAPAGSTRGSGANSPLPSLAGPGSK
jgi:DNA-binding response OmpR family regulator